MVRQKRSRNVMTGENLLNRSLSRCLTNKEGGLLPVRGKGYCTTPVEPISTTLGPKHS